MIRVRGMVFRDEDDAHDYFAQRELDDALAAEQAFHQQELLRQQEKESSQ